ncbi:site-specific DNA-methyltransferase [Sporosarcina sp. HYO08]|uniref:DNA-methyltransferase n=1 Tax=Sporosarcina sp. HYO08 TaxID=1759557 RepID=UPI00079430F2|nr:site-specific DNA-methyltransferase [Sporosarcina sp. HYO08]KXH87543.1 DNA methylase [Sporosarcina sp. HYO08]
MKSNQILNGDVREVAKELEPNSIQTIITSPPYFGLRKYSKDAVESKNEIGREQTITEYIDDLVSVFENLKPALKKDGTVWVNLGDAYVKGNLQGAPWRFALAMQDKGWILRSDIIWHKPNAMPSSVKNRPTTDHEYIFLFTLDQKNYYYNADAIREEHVTFSENSKMKGGRNHLGKKGGTPEQGKNAGNPNLHDGRWDQAFHPLGRNKRTVWNIPLGKYKGAHFAVFPEKLVETCLLASTKEGDIVLDPFFGSGTTGVVALKHNRDYLGIELVKEYAELAQNRLNEFSPQLNLFGSK